MMFQSFHQHGKLFGATGKPVKLPFAFLVNVHGGQFLNAQLFTERHVGTVFDRGKSHLSFFHHTIVVGRNPVGFGIGQSLEFVSKPLAGFAPGRVESGVN